MNLVWIQGKTWNFLPERYLRRQIQEIQVPGTNYKVKDNTQNEIQINDVLDCVAESSFFELKYTGWRGAVTPIFQLKNNCSGVKNDYFTKPKSKIFPLRGLMGS